MELRTCRELKRECDLAWNAVYKKYHKDIKEARDREFPIGSKVTWSHGASTIHGTVVDHPSITDWSLEQVIVENSKTKNRKDVKAYLLEKEDS